MLNIPVITFLQVEHKDTSFTKKYTVLFKGSFCGLDTNRLGLRYKLRSEAKLFIIFEVITARCTLILNIFADNVMERLVAHYNIIFVHTALSP